LTILKIQDEYLPFLSETEILKKFPSVTVDMGAVKFMCNGANLMRPGIRKFTPFDKEQLVCIVEESQNKFLAIGKSTMSSFDAEKVDKGEVLKNLHYISDKFWEIGKTIYD
jgi:PUA domain protein